MKGILCCFALTLLLLISACATGQEQAKQAAFYAKFDQHCREHARDMAAEVDEQDRYEECMTYFIHTDADCPLNEQDPHLSKAE